MHNLCRGLVCLLTATALSTGVAQAGEADTGAQAATPVQVPVEENYAAEGEIIVTAQKRSERLSTVPLSITAASGDELQRQNINSVADLPKIAPGLTFTKSAYSAPVFTIRGIGSYDEAIAISPTVSVYVDQVPLPFSRMTEGASLDIERVEILKGPQGTLFGQNSTGGAINYIANKPTNDFRAGGDFTLGRFGQADVQGFISGPLAVNMTARLAVRTEQRGDWQQSYTRNDKLGQRNFSTARLLLDIRPSDTILLEFGAEGWYNKSDTQAKQKIGYSRLNPSASAFLDSPGFPTLQADLAAYPNAPRDARAADWDSGLNLTRDDSFYRFSLRAEAELSDRINLTSLSSYSKLDVYSPNENDGTSLPDGSIVVDGSIEAFTQELRLAGELGIDDQVKWMFGGNYEHDITSDVQALQIRATNSGLRIPGGPFRWTQVNNLNEQRVATIAAFASLDVDLTDQITLQGSIRYTDQNRDFHGCLFDSGNGELARAFSALSSLLSGSPTTIPAGGCVTLDPVTNKPLSNGINTSLDENNLSWRAGLSWKPSSDLMLYANVTKGYKAGTYGTIAAIRPSQAVPVPQESVLAYEAGFKSSLFGRIVQLSGAAFYYDYTRKQLLGSINLGPPFGTLPALVSIPKSRVWGAELDLVVRPAQGLTFRGAGTYVNSRVNGSFVLADPLPALRPTGIDIGGSSFPNTPRWQISGDAEYRFAVSDSWRAFTGGNVSYRSGTRSFFGGNDDFILPGYALVDLRAGFEREDGSLRISVWGRNVTNKYYKAFVTRAVDTIVKTSGMPVTYGITIGTKF